MPTEDDNATLAKKLRKACPRPNLIKLPGSITFTINAATVRLHLASSCVEANMQDNSSSFEGWALALRRWLPEEVARIEIGWDFSGKDRDPHYQRFLFRVQQFMSLFPSWFSIASPKEQDELIKLRTNAAGSYVVTAPKKTRPIVTQDKDAIAEMVLNEHKLECFINEQPKPLSALFGITQMDRQYPVGVFEGVVKKGTEIFPRGHSAIDLWGTGQTDELFLFELKASKNTPIGILSELFFYSYIMEGIQQGRFTLQVPDSRITSTKTVRSYILAPQWHPLIDKEVLQMANDAFKEKGRRIRFGAVRIVADDPKVYILKVLACD